MSHAPSPVRRLLVAGLVLAHLACTGSIRSTPPGETTGTGASPPAGPGTPPGGPAPAAGCKSVSPGPSPLRRLTRSEYDNTIADLLGDQTHPAKSFTPDELTLGFDNNAQTRVVSELGAQEYLASAEQLAKAAVARLSTLLPCDPATKGELECLDQFLDTFGKRAWRHPLDPDERANLVRAYHESSAGTTSSFVDGIQAVIQVMLISPQFLYRVEKGVPVPGQGYQRLTPYEVASRLSYLLWGSMPDDQLFAAADRGQLATRDQVLAQARRMLDDPRAAAMVGTFTDEWLRTGEIANLEKSPEVFPTFKPELRASLHQEVRALLDQVWKGDGKLDTLLTAPFTFVDGPLAAYYGLPAVTGPGFQQATLDPKQRQGVLTSAGLLAVVGVNDDSLASLIYRGVFVRGQLLCQPLPDPPADAAAMNPPFTATTTARQWSDLRRGIGFCAACHDQIDPIGFGLEHFDGAGLWRDTDHGQPVDARGQLAGTDVDGAFDGATGLVGKLAASQTVKECLATQWFRYGFGRKEVLPDDSCALDDLKKVASSSGGSFRELLLALTQTDTFLLRTQGDQ